MRDLIIICLMVAGGYFLYTTYFDSGRQTAGEVQWQQNAALMKSCIKRETSMGSLGGLGGVAMDPGDAEALCAENNKLYLDNGHWKSR